jgi:hypothetical protein
MVKYGNNVLLIKDKPKTNFIVHYIKQRISKNKNFLGIICGSTGSGKSFSAIELARQVDPNFTLDRCVFKVKDLMANLNEAKLYKGACLVFDEAGVGIPAREWYSISNKLINYVLQTFRHKNLVVLFTTPDFSFIDSSARKLFHCYFETSGIDYKNKVSYLKPLFIQNAPKIGKTYYKYLRVFYRGNIATVRRVSLPCPPSEIIKEYENRKKNFTHDLNRGVAIGVKNYEIIPEKDLTPRQKEVYELKKEGLTGVKVAEKLGLTPQIISTTLKACRAKGFV